VQAYINLPASPAQIRTVILELITCDRVGRNDLPPNGLVNHTTENKGFFSRRTIAACRELVVWRIRTFSVGRLSANCLHHSWCLKILDVCLGRERIIARTSNVVHIEIRQSLQRTLNRRVADVVCVTTCSVVARETWAFSECRDALLLVGGNVCAILLRRNKLPVSVVSSVIDVVLVLVG
jgi:hypothetical protein